MVPPPITQQPYPENQFLPIELHEGTLPPPAPPLIRKRIICNYRFIFSGLSQEGIYRLSGVKSKIEMLKELYNQGGTLLFKLFPIVNSRPFTRCLFKLKCVLNSMLISWVDRARREFTKGVDIHKFWQARYA